MYQIRTAMQVLFNDLNIQAIVIIEDETTVYSFDEYLSLLLSNKILLESLTEVPDLVIKSLVFLAQLTTFGKTDEIKSKLDFSEPSSSFSTTLEPILQTALNELLVCYTNVEEEKLLWNKLANLDSNYEHLSSILNETQLPIHYMNNIDFTTAKEKLSTRLSQYNSEGRIFYIIDKTFGGYEKGYDIIKFLREAPVTPLPISIIFTSTPSQASNSINGYFQEEISKEILKKSLIPLIAEASKNCEYVYAIETLFAENSESLKTAKNEIIKSKPLFSKIIQTAHDEGVSPYEVINEWLILSQNYYFSHSMAEKLGSIFSSSKVFLDHTPSLLSNTNVNEMHFINSFEIFDAHVNKKYLPVAPGDIFQLDHKYYVAVGQACDTSCRSNSTRKTNVAELLEASITTKKYSDKAQMLSDNDGTSVIFRHFPVGEETKQLKIDVNKLRTIPFDLLDLAAYNSDGECKIDTDAPLSDLARNILPKGQIKKYSFLQKSLSNLFSKHQILQPLAKDLFNHLSFHFLSENVSFAQYGDFCEDKFHIDTKFKRVARIKGNFNYFLNKARHDYIGRVDLNGIHFNSEHELFEMSCNYLGESYKKIINATYDRDKKGWSINKQELINAFPEIIHFKKIKNTVIIREETDREDSNLHIKSSLINDNITVDCSIDLKYKFENKTDIKQLYGGKSEYIVKEIFKNFVDLHCSDTLGCHDIQNILEINLNILNLKDHSIPEFGVKLTFDKDKNTLIILREVQEEK